MLIDTHAHLDFPQFINRIDQVLERAAANKVTEMITIGIDLETSRTAISIASRYLNIWATVGIHPHGAHPLDSLELGDLRALALSEQVVAVGEVGLDYYRDRQPRDIQQSCLRAQLDLAAELGLPAVFHVRDAYGDFLAIAAEYADHLPPSVLHCFSGDWAVAEHCLALGWYLSIPGIVTFARADALQDVVRKAPLERLLLETDSPYLAPVPYRGKDNEPAYLLHTAERVAELKGLPLEKLAAATMANAHRVFRITAESAAVAGGGYA
jgi:TatD DNase family protein